MTSEVTAPAPKVSVVVATYQPGDGLQRLVDSLDRQTMAPSDFEMIFVDDGSPDDTFAQLTAVQATRGNVRLERIPNSGWPSRPRNVGLELARGEYVLFMDHDDEIFPDGLRAAYEFALEHDLDILSVKEVKTSSPGFGFEKYLRDSAGSRDELGVENLIPMMPHKLYRRQLMLDHEVRFPEGREMFWEDVYFNVDAYAVAERIGTIAHTAVYRRIMGGSNASKGYRPQIEGFWPKVLGLFEHVAAVFDDEKLARDRLPFLLHTYRIRVLDPIVALLVHKHDQALPTALAAARTVNERWIPAEALALLPARYRQFGELLRREDLDEMRAQAVRASRVIGLSHSTGVEWDADELVIAAQASWTTEPSIVEPGQLAPGDGAERALLAAELDTARSSLTVVNRESRETTPLDTAQATKSGDPDDPLRTLTISARGRLGPSVLRTDAVFDVQANNAALGFTNQRGLRTDVSSLVALIDGRAIVAYRNKGGVLSVDTAQRVRSAVNTAAHDYAGARITRSLRGTHIVLPLGGVHVHGRTSITGLVRLKPAGERRSPLRARAARGAFHAELVGDADGARVEMTVRAPRGRYQLSFSFGDRVAPSAIELVVPWGRRRPTIGPHRRGDLTRSRPGP